MIITVSQLPSQNGLITLVRVVMLKSTSQTISLHNLHMKMWEETSDLQQQCVLIPGTILRLKSSSHRSIE